MTEAKVTPDKFRKVYERFVKPLEAEHWGEFVAVTEDGRFLLGTDMDEVAVEASRKLGKGLFLYRVGPRAVGRLGGYLRTSA